MKRLQYPLLALFVLAIAGQSLASQPVGELIAVEGVVSIERAAGGSVKEAQIKAGVFLDDVVLTGSGSRAQILFRDDSVISQGENSRMVVDEYVYNPAKKKSKCSLKFAKGVFRVITGKITELNPERFKVRTRMATIGIRGCELGFRLRRKKEDVYVIRLGNAKSVFIERRVGDATGIAASGDIEQESMMNVVNAGVVVSLQAGLGKMMERAFSVDDIRGLINDSTPDPSGGVQQLPQGPDLGAKVVQARKVVQEAGEVSNEQKNEEEQDKLAEEEKEAVAMGGGGGIGQDGTYGAAPSSRPSLASRPDDSSDELTPDAPPSEDDGPSDDDVFPPSPDDDGFPPLPAAIIAEDSGTDWYWALWDDESFQSYGDQLTSVDYTAIVNGTPIYNLTGVGSSGAHITKGPSSTHVTGSCSMNVAVGGGATPGWDAQFSLANAGGDSLAFDAAGTIGAAGALSGATTAYNLNVGGVNYSVTPSESISGHLVGTGSGATPISGAYGGYQIVHSDSTTVNGVFGVDLSSMTP